MEEGVDLKGFAVKHCALSFANIQTILSNAWAVGGGTLKTVQLKEEERSTRKPCVEVMLPL